MHFMENFKCDFYNKADIFSFLCRKLEDAYLITHLASELDLLN